jgi:hypothetical protein
MNHNHNRHINEIINLNMVKNLYLKLRDVFILK